MRAPGIGAGVAAGLLSVVLVAASPVVFAQSTAPTAPQQRVSGIVLLVGEGEASIRQCHVLPGQVQALDFSAQARAVVDAFIDHDSGWTGSGDFPAFYLDGWARLDGNGRIVVRRVEAMSMDAGGCDPDVFVGGGFPPPWSLSLQAGHVSLETGYPGARGERRRYSAEAEVSQMDNGGYRWQSAAPAVTVTIRPGVCLAGLRGGDVKMWQVTVQLPESDPSGRLIGCATRGGAPLPQFGR